MKRGAEIGLDYNAFTSVRHLQESSLFHTLRHLQESSHMLLCDLCAQEMSNELASTNNAKLPRSQFSLGFSVYLFALVL